MLKCTVIHTHVIIVVKQKYRTPIVSRCLDGATTKTDDCLQ